MGKLLDRYPAVWMFDLDLQDLVFHEVFPEENWFEHLPFIYSPWFSIPLPLLARLSYARAFGIWIIVSVCLSVIACLLILLGSRGIAKNDRLTALLICTSYQPLIMETWIGGQTSAFALFFLATMFVLSKRKMDFAAGAALAFLSYKPTLLVVIVPMLLVVWRIRMLAGFACTILIMTSLSMTAFGWSCVVNYAWTLLHYEQLVESKSWIFKTFKYVDLKSSIQLMTGADNTIAKSASLLIGIIVLLFSARYWRKIRAHEEGLAISLALATTLTPLLNLYGPIYDTIIIIPGMIITANLIRSRAEFGIREERNFELLIALLYCTPMFTQICAMTFGLQPMTLALIALAWFQFSLLRRLCQNGGFRDHSASS